MKLLQVILGFIDKLRRDRADAYAAQSAFYTILSAVPFLMMILSAVQYIPVTQSVLEDVLNNYLPKSFQGLANGIVQEIYSKSPALLSITAVVTIWIAAKGIQALTSGLNSVYEIEETRPWIILRFRAAVNTLLLVISVVVLMLLVVFGNRLEDFFMTHTPVLGQFMEIFFSNRLLIMSVLLVLVFDIFYVALPNRKATMLGQLPGAVLCTVTWLLFSYGFSIYVNYSGTVSMYGSLTTLVITMMWLYFCMYFILLFGAVNFYFNSLFRRLRLQFRDRKRIRREKRLRNKLERTGRLPANEISLKQQGHETSKMDKGSH